jgi:hypothetical protein
VTQHPLSDAALHHLETMPPSQRPTAREWAQVDPQEAQMRLGAALHGLAEEQRAVAGQLIVASTERAAARAQLAELQTGLQDLTANVTNGKVSIFAYVRLGGLAALVAMVMRADPDLVRTLIDRLGGG